MTKLSVEGLQQALVVRQPHLVEDELDPTLVVSQLSTEPLGEREQYECVAVRTREVDLNLASALRELLDCHGLSLTQNPPLCTGPCHFCAVSITDEVPVVLPLSDNLPQQLAKALTRVHPARHSAVQADPAVSGRDHACPFPEDPHILTHNPTQLGGFTSSFASENVTFSLLPSEKRITVPSFASLNLRREKCGLSILRRAMCSSNICATRSFGWYLHSMCASPSPHSSSRWVTMRSNNFSCDITLLLRSELLSLSAALEGDS